MTLVLLRKLRLEQHRFEACMDSNPEGATDQESISRFSERPAMQLREQKCLLCKSDKPSLIPGTHNEVEY